MSLTTEAKAVAERLNKKLGPSTVMVASDISYQTMPRIPTGSLALDVALGGGWPANQWNEIVGYESHGKTALALKTVAASQALDPDWTCVWIAAEEFVPSYAKMLGCDLERIILVDTNVMEDAYNAVLDYLESKVIDCIVIDSLPALVPGDEALKLMEELQVGLGARLSNKFFRKARKAGHRSMSEVERPCTGIVINQWREKIGVMHGDPRTTPGGQGKNFHYFTRIEVRRDDWIEGTDKRRIGQVIKCRIRKNKSAPPERVAVFDFYFEGDEEIAAGSIDRVKDVFVTALQFDVVRRAGAFYAYGDGKWQGRAKAMDAIRADPELFDAITQEVMEIVKRRNAEAEA